MPSDLPHTIAPERLAREGVHLQGQLQLRNMYRLAPLLSEPRGAVDVTLAFSRSERGFTCITGNYATCLELVCQRCLEPLSVSLAAGISVGVTLPDKVKQLPGSLEPLVLTGETMLLTDFIEDEILLGLPLAPMHEPEECAVGKQFSERKFRAPNPFHVLKTLKSENH